MDANKFIENVKALSKAKGVAPKTACRESGVGENLLSNIANGSSPSIGRIEGLADYFGVSVDALIGGDASDLIHVYDVYKVAAPPPSSRKLGDDFCEKRTPRPAVSDPTSAPIDRVEPELREYLDQLRNRDEMRMLFSVTKGATKEQVEAIVKMIESMQDKS